MPHLVRHLDRPVQGIVRVPGSKSLTARALIAAAMAEGDSTITGALVSDDTERMVDSLRRLGVDIPHFVHSVGPVVDPCAGSDQSAGPGGDPGDRLHSQRGSSPSGSTEPVVVHGADHHVVRRSCELDVGLAGTVARFLTPVVATGDRPVVVDGTMRMRERPMADLVEALRQLGATVEPLGRPGHLPLQITGPLLGGSVKIAGDTSSQFLSGLLLAAPAMPRGLQVTVTTPLVSRPYVDMTIATMASFGVDVTVTGAWNPAGPGAPSSRRPTTSGFTVAAGQRYRATDLAIEPDASAASYVFAAAALTGSRLAVAGVHRRSVQGDVAFVDVLAAMGATVTDEAAGISVAGPDQLAGVTVDMADCSDVAQSVMVLAPFAAGATTITGIGFIRAKESDRIGATVAELRRCGVEADELPDGVVVRPSTVRGATIDTHGDHRMAMSFAALGLRVPGMTIADPGVVAKTFPGFFDMLDSLRRLPPRARS